MTIGDEIEPLDSSTKPPRDVEKGETGPAVSLNETPSHAARKKSYPPLSSIEASPHIKGEEDTSNQSMIPVQIVFPHIDKANC